MYHYGRFHKIIIELGEKYGAGISTYSHPEKGPQEDIIFCDSLYFGPLGAEKIMVIISGTHGLEGPAGAEFQIRLLETMSRNMEEIVLPDNTGLLIIFALNPWGFAYGERTDDENIDVNRSALSHCDQRITGCGHEKVVDVICPDKWDSNVMPSVMKRIDEMGLGEFQRAVAGGQFDYPKSLFYGGREEAWSVSTLRKICKFYLSETKEIAVMDVHTGLGEYAKGDRISPATDINGELAKRTRQWLGLGVQFPNVAGGQSVSSSVAGDILSAMVRWLPEKEVTPVAVEVGVLSVSDALSNMMASNWARFNEDIAGEDFLRLTKMVLWETFYPAKDKFWHGAVWSACYNVFRAMMAGLLQD